MIAQGECTPYPRYGESVESVIKAISHAAHELQSLYAKGEADVMALQKPASIVIARRSGKKCIGLRPLASSRAFEPQAAGSRPLYVTRGDCDGDDGFYRHTASNGQTGASLP